MTVITEPETTDDPTMVSVPLVLSARQFETLRNLTSNLPSNDPAYDVIDGIQQTIEEELMARPAATRCALAFKFRNFAAELDSIDDGEDAPAWSDEAICRAKLIADDMIRFGLVIGGQSLHPETRNGASGNGREKVRQNGEAADRFTQDTAMSATEQTPSATAPTIDLEALAIELRGASDAVIGMWDAIRKDITVAQDLIGLGFGPVHGLDWATARLRDIAKQIWDAGCPE